MDERTLAELFERWRSRGDLDALAAVFDRTAPQLLALGVHLVRDPVEAEDLVQGTFLAAIEGARDFDGARRLEAWLAGILVHQAQRVRRERVRRRPDPERVAQGAVPDPARAAEERELASALTDALDTLDEPYRSVLAAHLRGERALDIARASGRAPGTVRMQILRGLERLRRVLPSGLLAVVPVHMPRGLAGVRAEVLGQGALAASAGAGVAIGGTTMWIKAVAAVTVACGLSLVAYLRTGDEVRQSSLSETAAAEPASERSAPAAIEAGALELAAAPAAPVERRTADASSAPGEQGSRADEREPGLWLVGRLRGVPFDPADTDVGVWTEAGSGAADVYGTEEGTYALELTDVVRSLPGAATLHVTATHPSGRRAQARVPFGEAARELSARERVELELDLELTEVTAVVGRVAADCELTTVDVALANDEPFRPTTNCDTRGRFVLFPERTGPTRLIACRDGFLPRSVEIDVLPGRVTDAGTLSVDDRGVAIEGRLALGFAWPAGDAPVLRVRAERAPSSYEEHEDLFDRVRAFPERVEVGSAVAYVAQDGSFRIEGLEPGPYALALERDGDGVLVLSHPVADVTAPVSGIVFGQDYGRLAVTVRGVAGEEVLLSCGDERGHVTTTAPEDRPVELVADRRVRLHLQARAPGSNRAAELVSPAGTRSNSEAFELQLESVDTVAALEIGWSLPVGTAVPEWMQMRIHWTRDGSGDDRTTAASATGCRVSILEPGHYRFEVEPDADSPGGAAFFLCAPPFEADLYGGRTTRVQVEWRPSGGARLLPDAAGRTIETARAVVRDARGVEQPVRFAQHEFNWEGVHQSSTYTGSMPLSVPSVLEPTLPPGAYELVLSDDETELARVSFTVVAGTIVDVPVVLR